MTTPQKVSDLTPFPTLTLSTVVEGTQSGTSGSFTLTDMVTLGFIATGVPFTQADHDKLDGLGAGSDVVKVGTPVDNQIGVWTGDGTIEGNTDFTWDGECFALTGSIEMVHTASEADDHAIEIDVNAAGFGDVKALDVVYTTGALAAGSDESIMLINIDESASTGGDIIGLEVLATEGSASVYGYEAGVGVNPVVQLSGTFGDMDSALSNAANVLTAFTTSDPGGANNVTIFAADNDTVTIGNAAKFEEIEFLLEIVASGGGISPTFEFSTGVGTWSSFTPTDGTNGMRNTGVIAWLDSDIPSWAVGTGSEYLIRITRTRNNLGTAPVEDKVQIAVADQLMWDKDGNLTINNVSCAALTSNGIDDNATGERLQIADTTMNFGSSTAASSYTLRRPITDGSVIFTGGSTGNLGANIQMFGESHASLANDTLLRSGTSTKLQWDDSGSTWNFQNQDVTGIKELEFAPGTSVTPVSNGDVVIEATNNTTLTFKLKGTDGTVRSGTVTLS